MTITVVYDANGNPHWLPEDKLTLNDYSNWVEGMIITTGQDRLVENTLGLVGEAGEVAEKVKKIIRDGTVDVPAITKELGDVLFYVTALSNYFSVDIETIMHDNIRKLEDRKARNVIQGSGDSR